MNFGRSVQHIIAVAVSTKIILSLRLCHQANRKLTGLAFGNGDLEVPLFGFLQAHHWLGVRDIIIIFEFPHFGALTFIGRLRPEGKRDRDTVFGQDPHIF